MTKKLWFILLGAVLLLCLLQITTPYTDGTVRVSLPNHSVILNGQLVSNDYCSYPLLVYKDITYFPMTHYDCKLLGLSMTWTEENGLSIEKNDASLSEYIRDIQFTKNSKVQQAQIVEGPITVNGQKIDNSKEPYPVLSFRDTIYFPLTWHFAVEEFGWDYKFDKAKGLTISNPKAMFISTEEWNGITDRWGSLMGTGSMELACIFSIRYDNQAEQANLHVMLYNMTEDDICLLENAFQWEYRIYRIIGEDNELVYRKAIPFYSGDIPKNHYVAMNISDSYWNKRTAAGDYRYILVHPDEYTYRIPNDGQIRTTPTTGDGYAVRFSEEVTIK